MKAVILAGGRGSRLNDETSIKPKPLIEIGGRPILWHIMKHYAEHGITDFIICLGYKGYLIKEYFFNYALYNADVSIDLKNQAITYHHTNIEPWKVTLVDTGFATQTGGRLKRIQPYLAPDQDFCFTYGDGVADIDVTQVITTHKELQRLATVTAVNPAGRFGSIIADNDKVIQFKEKADTTTHWVNAGFFVLKPDALTYIEGDDSSWEYHCMEKLTADNQLSVYYHKGFWQAMDTPRDKQVLEDYWQSGHPPWKSWL